MTPPAAHPVAVETGALRKCYRVYNTPMDRVLEVLLPWRGPRHREVLAVDGITLQIGRGEAVGIMGRNGSGKSTFLKMISGVLAPTSGTFAVHGKTSALLELGAGFDPDLPGLENIYLAGAFNGQTRAETAAAVPRILDFAELGDFIHHPVRTYSSGMFVRLAFAVAIDVNPDVLIVDEALAVGDVRFQAKCFTRLSQLKERGTTILFVSHSSDAIARFCSRALLIEQGRLLADGSPRDVNNRYQELLFGRQTTTDLASAPPGTYASAEELRAYAGLLTRRFEERPGYNRGEHRWGDGSVEIADCAVVNGGKADRIEIDAGEPTYLVFKVRYRRDVAGIVYGYYVSTMEGVRIHGINSRDADPDAPQDSAKAGEERVFCFRLDLRLASGSYLLSLGVATSAGEAGLAPLDRRYDSIVVQVNNPARFVGLAQLDAAFLAIPAEDGGKPVSGTG